MSIPTPLRPPTLPVTFVVRGAPRTKKNHSRIIKVGKFPRLIPSKQYMDWHNAVAPQLAITMRGRGPIDSPVNCRAIFLRDKNTGDLIGYMQALADSLEKAGVLVNDRLIIAWDGTRMDKDAADPRVIVTLEAA